MRTRCEKNHNTPSDNARVPDTSRRVRHTRALGCHDATEMSTQEFVYLSGKKAQRQGTRLLSCNNVILATLWTRPHAGRSHTGRLAAVVRHDPSECSGFARFSAASPARVEAEMLDRGSIEPRVARSRTSIEVRSRFGLNLGIKKWKPWQPVRRRTIRPCQQSRWMPIAFGLPCEDE